MKPQIVTEQRRMGIETDENEALELQRQPVSVDSTAPVVKERRQGEDLEGRRVNLGDNVRALSRELIPVMDLARCQPQPWLLLPLLLLLLPLQYQL